MQMNVSPRYGRDYINGAQAKKDWDAGKDFTVNAPMEWSGMAVSKTEFEAEPEKYESVKIRFNKNAHFVVIQNPNAKKESNTDAG